MVARICYMQTIATKLMRISVFVLFIFILLTSCRMERNESGARNISPNQIVLIFEDFPEPYLIQLNDTKGSAYTPATPELRYYDDNLIQRVIKPKTGTTDTVRVHCNSLGIEFRHSVRGIDNFDYEFRKGDTILFTYRDKIPFAKVINRNTSEFETNYDLKHREFVSGNDYPALIKVIMPFLFITYNSNDKEQEGERKGILGQVDKIKADAQLKFAAEVDLEKNFLDSLFDSSLLSNDAYRWLCRKLEIKKYTEKAYNDVLTRADVRKILSEDSDSLLRYHSYRNLTTTISSAFYDRKITRVISSNSNLPDYKLVYDSIHLSGLFSSRTKEILLFETSNLLIQNSSATEIGSHMAKVKNDIGDTLLISYLVDKYRLDRQLNNDLQLVDVKGNKTSLSTLVTANPGKAIYVDIWASWCAPCLEEFPKSKSLAEMMRSKNVLFIYLSVDDDIHKWSKASRKYELPDNYSFLIENTKTSTFLESVDFGSIPRYLIFNNKGVLEYKDAPRPSDERTLRLLEDLLIGES